MKNGTKRVSKIEFVKLHGSENIARLYAVADPEKIEQLKSIQRNLNAFTTALLDANMGKEVSKNSNILVSLLHDCICGNSKILMVLTASPLMSNREETIRTFRFGNWVSNIRINSKINEYEEKLQSNDESVQIETKNPIMKVIIYEGFMKKEGKLFKTWRNRYFVLNKDGVLAYYRKKGDEHAINSLMSKKLSKWREWRSERISCLDCGFI